MTAGRNLEWATSVLTTYRAALEHLRDAGDSYSFSTVDYYRESLSEANQLSSVATAIIGDLISAPEVLGSDLSIAGVPGQHISITDKALGLLSAHEQLKENWPTEAVASLDTSKLHPWVWDPARDLWVIARYKEALNSAAITVNARLQAKVGRNDLEFAPLARNAFSTKDPEEGQPRLRLSAPQEWGDEAWKDVHAGAANLGEAAFRLWRNLPSHKDYTIEEQPATEALGALSSFARMVDSAEVVQRFFDVM